MFRKTKKLVVWALVVSMILTQMLFTNLAFAARLEGSNRYQTAANIATANWTSSDYAVLATGEDFPDALAAAPLAKAYNAPILLTDKDSLNDAAKSALQTLKVKNVIIVGGSGVVSDAVKTAVEGLSIATERVFGANRYLTSLEVAKKLEAKLGVAPAAVTIATGADFADALSASSFSAAAGTPILLVGSDVEDAIVSYVGSKKATIVGGEGVVSAAVAAKFAGAQRLFGAGRYQTNLEVIKAAANVKYDKVYVATGNDFPDALAGAVVAAKYDAPIVLVDANGNADVASYLSGKVTSATEVVALGGAGVVSATAVSAIEAAKGGTVTPPTEALSVTSVTTVNGAALNGATVDRNVNVKVTLNKAVNADTKSSAYFKIFKGDVLVAQNPTTVSADAKTIFLRPTQALDENTDYKLVVSADVADKDGNKLGADKTYTFKTNSLNAVTQLDVVGATAGGTNVPADGLVTATSSTSITLSFIDGVNATTVDNTTVKLYDVTDNNRVMTDDNGVTVSGSAKVITINVAGAIDSANRNMINGHTYKVEVSSGVVDFVGNAVAAYSRSFTLVNAIGANPTTLASGERLDAQNVLATSKANPSLSSYTDASGDNVYPGFKLLVKFTRDIAANTLSDSSLYLYKADDGTKVAGTVAYNVTSKIATFTPNTALDANTRYGFIVSKGDAIKDTMGNKLNEQNPELFITMDIGAPVITSTSPESGFANFAKDGQMVITFNKEMKTSSFVYGNGAGATLDDPFAGGKTVILKNETRTSSAGISTVSLAANYTPSWDTATKVLTLKPNVGWNLDVNSTYTLMFKGYDKNAAEIQDSNNLELASDYSMTFATNAGDTKKPFVESVESGENYKDAEAITSGATNVDDTYDMYLVFNEKLAHTTTAGSIVLQKYDNANSVWNDAVTSSAITAVTDDLSNNKSYITIPAANIDADSKYKIKMIPSAVAGFDVKDTTGNIAANGWEFTFVTNGTLGLASTSATVTASSITADATKGATTLVTALNPPTTIVAIELGDGSFFFTNKTSSSPTALTIADQLPADVISGAAIIEMDANKGSFINNDKNIAVDSPLAIQINGAANDKVDISTVNSDTVQLFKGADQVSAKIDVKQIGNNAYVSINPEKDLDYNTQYVVKVQNIKDKIGNTISAKSRAFVTAKDSVKKLTIDSVTPADMSLGVAVNSTLVVNFNESVANRTSVSALTTAAIGASAAVALYDLDNTSYITGTIKWSNTDKTMTVTPDSFLKPNTRYQLQISTGLASSAGTDYTSTKLYGFTTENPASIKPAIDKVVYFDAGNDGDTSGDSIIVMLNTKANAGFAAGTTAGQSNAQLNALGLELTKGGDFGTSSSITMASDLKTITIKLGPNAVVIPNATGIKLNSSFAGTANGVSFSDAEAVVTK